jgi:hypothetical protein
MNVNANAMLSMKFVWLRTLIVHCPHYVLSSYEIVIFRDTAQKIFIFFPSFATGTTTTPEDIIRVNMLLDFQESWIIGSPKSMLKVRFIGICL